MLKAKPGDRNALEKLVELDRMDPSALLFYAGMRVSVKGVEMDQAGGMVLMKHALLDENQSLPLDWYRMRSLSFALHKDTKIDCLRRQLHMSIFSFCFILPEQK